ncbi:MAG: hypothetical protein GY853_02210 [PVC group bacterium]|nr:hypothetical protein [PVC group bacterium]
MKAITKKHIRTIIYAVSASTIVAFLSAWLTNDLTASYISGVVTYWGALIMGVVKK